MTILITQSIYPNHFSNTGVIHDLSLHINEGEFVSIIGPSGSGKSTIFHLIGGIMTPDME